MKSLTVMGLAIGLLVLPIQAQAQESLPGSPPSFNGLVWDPPTQAQAGAYASGLPSTPHHPRRNISGSERR
jgi:hypothetical protein